MAVSRCAHCRALTGSFATFVRQPLAQEKKPITRMKREPREMGVVAGVVALLLAAALAIAPAAAQVTGILGSPSATTTINGKQLPPPPRSSAA